jgi:4-hydroxymandelate oxidase
VHADRELATARAAALSDTVYVVSMAATTSLEDIAQAAPAAARWMQLYIQRDRGLTRDVCARASEAGYQALVVTVDSPVTTTRQSISAGNFGVPEGMSLPNMTAGHGTSPDLFALVAAYDASLTFNDLSTIRGWGNGMPLVVKGILRGDDAVRCLDAGADAIVVSNHGGRQVDGCIPTAHALRDVVDAVGDRAEVYVDGGVRDGTDVLKALAIGARAVLMGRSIVWALALGGEQGVVEVLTAVREDLTRLMGLCGLPALEDIGRDLVVSTS